jgi:hypothetical protein
MPAFTNLQERTICPASRRVAGLSGKQLRRRPYLHFAANFEERDRSAAAR